MILLVLGGSRSGKSVVAEELMGRLPGPHSYISTAVFDADDQDMARRVERHRTRRPSAWVTVEAGANLIESLREVSGSALVDALGTWVAASDDLCVQDSDLCAALLERNGDTVVVSEEVGMGVHPSSEIGRRFRDVLGEVNQAVAAIADHVLLVVAGRVLELGVFDPTKIDLDVRTDGS